MAKRKTRKGKIRIWIWILTALLLGLLATVGVMGYIVWIDSQEVFRNVTVELGEESLGIRDFTTSKAKRNRVSFVTDPGTIDLSRVGKTQIKLRHGIKVYSVTLTVEDTVAPYAQVEEVYDISITDGIPEAESLLTRLEGESKVTVRYAQPPLVPEDYSDTDVTIVAEDASGNQTQVNTRFHYYGWLKKSCTLELGSELTAKLVLQDPERDAALLENTDISGFDTVGEHTLTVHSGNTQESCIVTVQDTTAPKLNVQNVRIFPGESAEAADFVKSVKDISGEPKIRTAGDMPDFDKKGTYTVTIEAEDAYGNVASKEATLWISDNMSPPEIKGADKEMSIEKNASPDFLKGVSAKDDVDGKCEVTVDTKALDVTKAGTYYITYSAMDSSGNVGTYKRKVIVEPDEEDTKALVKKIAADLPNDPEKIRDYVHDNIAYSSNWGGDDPIWHGFNVHSGNCNVHARCLQALLEEKGYETQLIWVTNKSHYWLIIHLEEGWRHIDSTPSAQHEAIGLATDRVRYLNLNGRNWDRSKWPACK